jgi:hypothetical protein
MRFNLAMGRSPGFGSYPMRLIAQLRLAFATASELNSLTLPHKVTRRIIMQKARRHLTGFPKDPGYGSDRL